MFTLIVRNIFLIGDWTQRFWVRIGYYKFIVDSAASPRPCNFYMRLALGMEVQGKDYELHKYKKSGRNGASQNRNL